MLSTLNRLEKTIDGKMKALAAEDESSRVLGFNWIYQFDTLVCQPWNQFRSYPHPNPKSRTQSCLSRVRSHWTSRTFYRWNATTLKKHLATQWPTVGWQFPRSHRRQVARMEWQVNEVNWNNDLEELFRWTVWRSRTPNLRLARHSLVSGFPARISDKVQLKWNRTCICVRKSPSRADETVDNTQAGTTSSALVRSAKRWNPFSVNNTCGMNIYLDRHHYRPSVAADYQQIASICSKSSSRNSGNEDNRRMELSLNFWESRWCWHTWVFSPMLFRKAMGWKTQTFSRQTTGFFNRQRKFYKKSKKQVQIRPKSIRTLK